MIEERISDPALGNRAINYTYDPVGNRLTKTDNGEITEYTYDENDRLLTENEYAYTYDDNGNLLTKNGNGEEWQLTYNALNQVEHADISTSQGTSSLAYTYDHDGIRIGKTINGTEVVQYVVDKNRPYAQVLEEQHTRGGLSATTSYIYGDALVSAATEGSTHYYHTDGLGSVRHLSDASGVLTDSYTYDAYGLLTTSSGTTVNPSLYRGEQYDADLNAYYLRSRYYQSGIGRFLTTDPVEGFMTEPISRHRYLYGNNSPINYFDPSGESSVLEMLQTTAIINVLMTGASFVLEPLLGVYSELGERWLPDALMLGAVGGISIRKLTEIMDTAGVAFPSMPPLGKKGGIGGFGGEVIFNISSAQIGVLWYGFGAHQVSNPVSPGINVSRNDIRDKLKIRGDVGLYLGYMWNQWRVQECEGPSVTLAAAGQTYGVGVFFNPFNPLKSPWGMVRDLWGKTVGDKTKPKPLYNSRYRGFAYYNLYWNSEQMFTSEFEVGGIAVASVIAAHLLQGALDPDSNWKVGLVVESSLWWQVTLAKYHWNKSPTGFDVFIRQTRTREEADFESKSGLGILGQWLTY